MEVAGPAVDQALSVRRKWAWILGVATIPAFPVGLAFPAFLLYEARLLEATRGLRIRAETDPASTGARPVVVTVGGEEHRLEPTTVSAHFVRDMLVLTGRSAAGPQTWSIAVGLDEAQAEAAAQLRSLGIAAEPNAPPRPAELLGVLAYVIVDRVLAGVAGLAAFGAVMATIGAVLGDGHPGWICVGVGVCLGALVARALPAAIGSVQR